ncbi:macoilin-like isoform X1 [Amphibalanus amphitrite]|uniref:macoilin-like isoform X1 n=1 Tax=Amphibalanus amphitrite TaxID=1232801 RepID=UPI001C92434D|nr:macoilin-like isoform X1 [Amphibalanus amphitrite]
MKRRNADIAKLRRPLKKTKIGDGMYGSSTFTYLKMVLLWTAVLMCDFMFELRFEYFWPFWMFARSVYDSFRYQGLAFSLFFVLMTLTSDMICYIFIPVHWLFFAASTYVWVQYVWHAERGICIPTISLWILFIYIEASLRLKDEKYLFFHADLSRPFAAHCIGYPVISLGFSFKSYVGHRFRLRRQKLVARQNDTMVQLLQEALPPDMALDESPERRAVTLDKSDETISNGGVHDTSPKSIKKSAEDLRTPKCKLHNGSISSDLDFMEQRRSSINEFDESEDKEKNYKNCSQTQRSSKWASSCSAKEKRLRVKDTPVAAVVPNVATKDDTISKLEQDVKRLRVDLNSSRQTEQELRSQVSNLVIQERNARNQLHLLQLDNDSLQSKLHTLVTGRQQDKQAVVTLEKKVAEERKLRQTAESQLQQEKKKVVAATEQASKCTEQCKSRRRELEAETRQLRRENKQFEDKVRAAERELQSLHSAKDTQNDANVLMSALSAMQEKNKYLEKNLSSETRHKMNLVGALGDAKRELEISKSQLASKEREISELNAKLADVLSVMPSLSSPSNVSISGDHNGFGTGIERYSAANADLYDLKMTPETPAKSQLDPNAAAYTPKMA